MSPSTWYDKSSLVTLNQLAFKQSIGRWTSRVLSTGSQVEIQSQILDEFTIVWAVDEDVGEEGLMEGERLKMMFDVEQAIYSQPSFKTWCHISFPTIPTIVKGSNISISTPTCTPFSSVLDPSLPHSLISPSFLPMQPLELGAVLATHYCNGTARTDLALRHLSSSFDCSLPPHLLSGSISHLKSSLPLGGPSYKSYDLELLGDSSRPQFDNLNDDPYTQVRVVGNGYLVPEFMPLVKDLKRLSHAELGLNLEFGGVNWFGVVNYSVVMSYIFEDMKFALGSMALILFYLVVSLQSFTVAVAGFLMILLSVPLAFALVMALLGYTYVSFLQFMGVFIILGIGADDIFVFIEAWRQNKGVGEGEVNLKRFVAAHNRASSAMLTTSLTTFIAFFATSFSPIPTISSFGFTMALMVLANFALVVTAFPAVVVASERYGGRRGCGAKMLCQLSLYAPDAKNTTRFDKYSGSVSPLSIASFTLDVPPSPSSTSTSTSLAAPRPSFSESLSLFFSTTYTDLIVSPSSRRPLLSFFLLLFLVSSYLSSGLTVTGNLPVYFSPSHPHNTFRRAATSAFAGGRSLPKVQLNVFFGLDGDNPLDREGVDPQDNYEGRVNYNVKGGDGGGGLGQLGADWNAFNGILQFCRSVSEDEELVAQSAVGGNGSGGEVYCFAEDFVTYLAESGLAGGELSEGAFDDHFGTEGHAAWSRELTTARFGEQQPFTGVYTENGATGVTDFAFVNANSNASSTVTVTEDDDTAVAFAFAFVTFNTTLPLTQTDSSLLENRVVMDRWQEHVDEYNKGAGGAFQARQNCDAWYFLVGGEEIVRSTGAGIFITLVCVLAVLVVGTGSAVMALLAIGTICGIMVVLSAVMYLLGWSVDYLVSICLVVVIGLSVDYVVHICHAYMGELEELEVGEDRDRENAGGERKVRVRKALKEMGGSVVSGGATTFGASLFLLLTDFSFFNKFGFFLCATILISVLFSLGLFPCLLVEFGPVVVSKSKKEKRERLEKLEVIGEGEGEGEDEDGDIHL